MKKSYLDMTDAVSRAQHTLGLNTLWRHKGGDVYELLGIDVDADDGELRVRYQVRVSPHVAPGARNIVIFSRPIAEWTLDRFTRLT